MGCYSITIIYTIKLAKTLQPHLEIFIQPYNKTLDFSKTLLKHKMSHYSSVRPLCHHNLLTILPPPYHYPISLIPPYYLDLYNLTITPSFNLTTKPSNHIKTIPSYHLTTQPSYHLEIVPSTIPFYNIATIPSYHL